VVGYEIEEISAARMGGVQVEYDDDDDEVTWRAWSTRAFSWFFSC
jgi:hypothetical protein